jgi:predicted ATP-dependent endonuclease of OLD family
MLTTETKKLFYGKYIRRIKLTFSIAWILRPTDVKRNERILVDLEEQIKNDRRASKNRQYKIDNHWWRHVFVTEDDVKEARAVQDALACCKDVKVRVQRNTMCLYFNDISEVSEIKDKVSHLISEISEPDMKFLDSIKAGKEVVSRNYSNYQYSVVFNSVKDNLLPDWIAKNDKMYKISNYAKINLKRDFSPGTLQIYVKDTKALTMLQLRMSKSISHMYELVHK